MCGLACQDGDFVVINYTGYLSDGTIFDGLHAKGKKPLAFKVLRGLFFDCGGAVLTWR